MNNVKIVTIEHIRHTYLFDSLSKVTMQDIEKFIEEGAVTPDESIRIQEDIVSSTVISND